MQETTEPTVNASIDGSTDQPLLVDTGSSGLVIPISDLDSGSNEFAELLSLGLPSSFGESGYSGGVDYIYLTYNNLPVDYDLGGGSTLDTTAPVEVEVYSWDPSDLTSLFTNEPSRTFSPVTIQPAASWASGTMSVVGRAKARSRRLAMTV